MCCWVFGGQRMSVTCGIEVVSVCNKVNNSYSQTVVWIWNNYKCSSRSEVQDRHRDEAKLHWRTRMRIRKVLHHNTWRKHLLAFAFFWKRCHWNRAALDVHELWQRVSDEAAGKWCHVNFQRQQTLLKWKRKKKFTLLVSKKTVHCNTYTEKYYTNFF